MAVGVKNYSSCYHLAIFIRVVSLARYWPNTWQNKFSIKMARVHRLLTMSYFFVSDSEYVDFSLNRIRGMMPAILFCMSNWKYNTTEWIISVLNLSSREIKWIKMTTISCFFLKRRPHIQVFTWIKTHAVWNREKCQLILHSIHWSSHFANNSFFLERNCSNSLFTDKSLEQTISISTFPKIFFITVCIIIFFFFIFLISFSVKTECLT